VRRKQAMLERLIRGKCGRWLWFTLLVTFSLVTCPGRGDHPPQIHARNEVVLETQLSAAPMF
jgi:hypothetical protein